MTDKILIANSSTSEANLLKSSLSSVFDVTIIASKEQYSQSLDEFKLLLIDQNFTSNQGIDFLRSVLSNQHLPVLMISNEDDIKATTDALSAGAFNFIVKVDGYIRVLAVAIKDSIHRFYERQNLQEHIVSLKNRVTELETQLQTAISPKAVEAEHTFSSLLSDIISTLKSGDINLPIYPEIARNYKEMVDKGANVDQITSLLLKDAGISAKLISVSNSPYYQSVSPTNTLEQAISRIGIVETRNYVELISNRTIYSVKHVKFEEYLDRLWQHSLACAYTCLELAKKLEVANPTELFTMGLFHDIGKLLLVQIISELENKETYEQSIPKSEWTDIVSSHHGQFGSALMKKWGLSHQYSYVVKFHEDIDQIDQPSDEVLIVNLGNLIAISMGFSETDENIDASTLAQTTSAQQLKLPHDAILEVSMMVTKLMKAGSVL